MNTKKKPAESSQPERLVRRSVADIRAYIDSPQFKKDAARIKAIKDEDIDFSDMPELTDEQLAAMYPASVQISIRLDGDVLRWLQSKPGRYQTRLNNILRLAMAHEARQTDRPKRKMKRRDVIKREGRSASTRASS